MRDYTITVTCASGIEKAVKKELLFLCRQTSPAIDGAMDIKGDDLLVARLNTFLRTADRVYIKIGEFKATTFDELFDGTKALDFENYISKNGQILVNGKCKKSKIYAISASQSVIKKAIVERLKKAYRTNFLSESAERYKIEFSIVEDNVSVYLDTSGTGLHKRGYRDLVWNAPIRENLAASMVLYSGYRADVPFADVFCGSGTIPIETAMIANNIACGKNREFDFMKWGFFDKKAYVLAKEEALDKETNNPVEIVGTDIAKKAIELSKHHAKRAGVDKFVKFRQVPVKDFKSDLQNGIIVTNAPYGERSLDKESAALAYKDLYKTYMNLNGWSLHLLTEFENFERTFGKKADRNRKLYNSSKECRVYSFFK